MAKTIQEVISEVVSELESDSVRKDDEEIIEKIQEIIRELKGVGSSGMSFEQYSPDELSKLAGSLAIYKVTLGNCLARASRSQRLSEQSIKLKKANLREPLYEKLKEKKSRPTVDDLKAEITRRVFKDEMVLTFKEEHHNRLHFLWWSLKSMLAIIDQRIRVQLNDRGDSKFLDNNVVPDMDLSQLQNEQ